MSAVQPRVRLVERRCAPRTYPCPTCGTKGRRQDTHTRDVRGLAYGEILWIRLTTGAYRARCGCCTTFRSQVDGIEPRAAYTNHVREAVLDRLLEDGMNRQRLQQALRRDFLLDLSDGFLYDCLDWKVRQLDGADYRAWTLEHFSGTLCIDELHLGKKTLLLATDPLHDFPVAFALVGQNDQEHMGRFLGQLKAWGFLPGVVVTDGSNLYPTLLEALWPSARHQLCVFHVLKDLGDKVLDAVKRLRRQKARQGNAGRKRPPGRPRKGAKRRRGPTAKDKAHFVFKRRHLIVTRRENLSERQRQDLTLMLEYLPGLRVLRTFVDRLQRLFAADQSEHQARCRRAALLRAAEFQAVPELVAAMGMLSEEKFAKMVAFVHSPAHRRVRTNNHVERTNRKLRYLEKVRYKWRRRRTIVRFVLLALDRWRRRQPAPGPQGQPEPTTSPGRPAAPHVSPACDTKPAA